MVRRISVFGKYLRETIKQRNEVLEVLGDSSHLPDGIGACIRYPVQMGGQDDKLVESRGLAEGLMIGVKMMY